MKLRSGRGAYVYVLFEHQSGSEPLIALHLLRYMVKIWEQWLQQGGVGPLPPIIPWVVYPREGGMAARPGSAVPFCPGRGALGLSSRLSLPALRLSAYSDEAIRGMVTLRVALLVLKYIFRKDWEDRLPGILGLLRELTARRSGLEYLETVLTRKGLERSRV